MANQPLAFGLLLGGGVLLMAGLSGEAVANVLQGKVKHLPSGPQSIGGAGATNMTATVNAAGYTNPLAQAKVTPERIDMGVDYAGSGQLVAAGRAKITHVDPKGWGKYGGFIQYQLLDGPMAGHFIYYAEGVTSLVKVGDIVAAGAPIASIIPGWHSGIEIGWGSGKPNQAYASVQGGGYSEGQLTAAGKAFSDFIASLGGAGGTVGGRQTVGSFK